MDLKQLVAIACCSGRNRMWDTQVHHFSTFTTVVYNASEQEQSALMQGESYLFNEWLYLQAACETGGKGQKYTHLALGSIL